MPVTKVVSGGQTGADQAALDAALRANVPIGGWVPAGRVDENGPIPDRFSALKELSKGTNDDRTRQNVIDSDGTLIIASKKLSGGTKLTRDIAGSLGKPCLVIDHTRKEPVKFAICRVQRWVEVNSIKVLNVAGPRHTDDPDVNGATHDIIYRVLTELPEKLPRKVDPVLEKAISEFSYNFRHWDVLRWQIPSWFISLAAVLATLSTNLNTGGVRADSFFVLFFGLLCIFLEYNLVIYHNRGMQRLSAIATERLPVVDAYELTKDLLPFSFSAPYCFRTATFWFMVLMFLITGAAAYIFLSGDVFWLTGPKKDSCCYFYYEIFQLFPVN